VIWFYHVQICEPFEHTTDALEMSFGGFGGPSSSFNFGRSQAAVSYPELKKLIDAIRVLDYRTVEKVLLTFTCQECIWAVVIHVIVCILCVSYLFFSFLTAS
jgi:hypothetical protein